MALTALNIARCIIAIARKKRPGLIGGGAPTGWTVLTPISSQSVITLADAVAVGAPASNTPSASSPRCCIMKSSLFYLRHHSEIVGASFWVSKPGYLRPSQTGRLSILLGKRSANSLADLSGSLRSLPFRSTALPRIRFHRETVVCIPTCSVSERAPAQRLAFWADRRAVRMTALIDLTHTWSTAHLQAILGNQRNFTRRMYSA